MEARRNDGLRTTEQAAAYLSALPDLLKANSNSTMAEEVGTGNERPKETNAPKAFATAVNHKETAWAQLRKLVFGSWIRGALPSMRDRPKGEGVFMCGVCMFHSMIVKASTGSVWLIHEMQIIIVALSESRRGS